VSIAAQRAHDHSAGHSLHPHDHRHDVGPTVAARQAAGAPSPLWWSAPHRLVCAGLLSACLWLVIVWAVR
jgi:hypothetical protein